MLLSLFVAMSGLIPIFNPTRHRFTQTGKRGSRNGPLQNCQAEIFSRWRLIRFGRGHGFHYLGRVQKTGDSFDPSSIGASLNQVTVPDLWQQQAVSALREGIDVVVQAPTGSGKTLIFELWSNQGKPRGQAIYTVPTRALANDKLA